MWKFIPYMIPTICSSNWNQRSVPTKNNFVEGSKPTMRLNLNGSTTVGLPRSKNEYCSVYTVYVYTFSGDFVFQYVLQNTIDFTRKYCQLG